MPATMTTSLNRKWYIKLAIFFVFLVGFGLYGLYDATIAYPERGRRHAEFLQYQYLLAADTQGRLRDAGVAEPVEARSRLRVSRREQLPELERARLDWLDSLALVGALTPAHTQIADPRATLDALDQSWKSKNPPKGLTAYDIPVQWIFVAAGLGGGLWMAVFFLRAARVKYGWDPAEKRLYLQDGSSLLPSDITEFDKRKWDKFLIFLHVKEGHPPHGGNELKLDLLRYTPLEEWVLEMERTAFPPEEQQQPAPDIGGGGEGRGTSGDGAPAPAAT